MHENLESNQPASSSGSVAPPAAGTAASPTPVASQRQVVTWGSFGLLLASAALTGLLLAAAFPPIAIWPLVFTALVPWIVWLPSSTWKGAALSAFVVGGVWYGVSLDWLGALSPIAYPVVVGLLSAHLWL